MVNHSATLLYKYVIKCNATVHYCSYCSYCSSTIVPDISDDKTVLKETSLMSPGQSISAAHTINPEKQNPVRSDHQTFNTAFL